MPLLSDSDKKLEFFDNKIVLSLISTCVELTIVCEPSICKFPLIITVPAFPISLLIPYGPGSI